VSGVDSTPSLRPARGSSAAAQWRERDILDWIRGLTSERDHLRRSHQGRQLSAVETDQLRQVESTLDRSWDLVRQRRARRNAGKSWDDLSQEVSDLVTAYRR
jgi:hypothetical protein